MTSPSGGLPVDRGGGGADNGVSGLRMAELMAALSLAIDLGVGYGTEWVMKTCLVSVRLGRALGLPETRLRNAYYLSLLRHVGCTATSSWAADFFGDELALADGFRYDLGDKAEAFTFMLGYVGRGKPLLRRAAMVARLMAAGSGAARESSATHCEIAERLAETLGFDAEIVRACGQINERWDGKGSPGKAKGEGLAEEVRIVHLAQDAVTLHGAGGMQAVREAVRKRSGRLYDPRMAEAFLRDADGLLGALAVEPVWDAVMDAEPGRRFRIPEERFDSAAEAVADFADMKSPFLLGHSRGVAALACAAARACGLAEQEAAAIRRAGLLHDVGRVGVSCAIWDKPGPLSDGEWEKVRMHAYFTERILSRSPALARLGEMASSSHERLDGGGYPRRSPSAQQTIGSRLLAAADVYRALIEDRPYRPALSPSGAAEELRREAALGKLDSKAVEAILSAAGHRSRPPKAEPSGLSDREIEVIRLMARGLSNRDMGKRLFISPKTVGHHVQHIYGKIGVSTRAAAALYAVQNELLEIRDGG